MKSTTQRGARGFRTGQAQQKNRPRLERLTFASKLGVLVTLVACSSPQQRSTVEPASAPQALAESQSQPQETPDDDVMVSHLPMRIYFARGSAEISPGARQQIVELVAAIDTELRLIRLQIEGHSNPGEPDRGSLSLGRQRAERIAELFAELSERPPSFFVVVDFGSSRPVSCDPVSTCANGRVEFSLILRRPRQSLAQKELPSASLALALLAVVGRLMR